MSDRHTTTKINPLDSEYVVKLLRASPIPSISHRDEAANLIERLTADLTASRQECEGLREGNRILHENNVVLIERATSAEAKNTQLAALVPKELDIEKVKAFDYLMREDIFDRWIDEIPYLDDDCPEIIKAAREEK